MTTVRAVEPRDAVTWARLRTSLWPEDVEGEHADHILRYFDGNVEEPLEVLLAEAEDGTAIGMVELSIRAYAEGCVTDHVGYLEGWYVIPEARRIGVGRALVVAAEAWAWAQGCTEFASDAELDNTVSARVHSNLGFEDVGQLRCFRKALVDPRGNPDRA